MKNFFLKYVHYLGQNYYLIRKGQKMFRSTGIKGFPPLFEHGPFSISQTCKRLSSCCQLASHIIVKYCIDNSKHWPRHIATNLHVGLFCFLIVVKCGSSMSCYTHEKVLKGARHEIQLKGLSHEMDFAFDDM
jgi:hypothetical protein